MQTNFLYPAHHHCLSDCSGSLLISRVCPHPPCCIEFSFDVRRRLPVLERSWCALFTDATVDVERWCTMSRSQSNPHQASLVKRSCSALEASAGSRRIIRRGLQGNGCSDPEVSHELGAIFWSGSCRSRSSSSYLVFWTRANRNHSACAPRKRISSYTHRSVDLGCTQPILHPRTGDPILLVSSSY